MKVKVPAAVLALLVASGANSETLTLGDVIRAARHGSREVVAGQARNEAAQERLRQARGFCLPSVVLQELWVRTDSPAEVFAFTLNQQRFSLSDLMTSDPNRPTALATGVTRLEASLPLFTGGEVSTRIEQAGSAARAAKLLAGWVGEQAALAAAEAYVMVEQAEEFEALVTKARETVAAHVGVAAAWVDQGMLVRSELLRAEVELARVDDLLAQAQGNARVARANLAFRSGQPQERRWDLDPLPRPVALGEDVQVWIASADGRMDLAAAREGLRAGALEAKVRNAAFFPKVALIGRGDMVDDSVFGTRARSTTIMAVATINLFAGGSDRAAVAAARWEARAGAEDVARFADGIRLEVRQAFEAAQTARRRQVTAEQAIAAAREVERITKERFGRGIVKTLDVLDASTALREAETRELVARAEAQAALIRLAVVSGRNLEEVLR